MFSIDFDAMNVSCWCSSLCLGLALTVGGAVTACDGIGSGGDTVSPPEDTDDGPQIALSTDSLLLNAHPDAQRSDTAEFAVNHESGAGDLRVEARGALVVEEADASDEKTMYRAFYDGGVTERLQQSITVTASGSQEETIEVLILLGPSRHIEPGADVPPQLRVEGDHLETVNGERRWLQGVAVPSLEWTKDGEHVRRSIRVAIEDWNADVIRLAVADRFWFGRGENQHRGKPYRQLVDEAIATAAERGAYLVLDLHDYVAPRPEHVTFWIDAARRYKNHPAVIFGLLNEPHGVSWDVWRDGGTVRRDDGRFESPGMQGVLEAARGTGANNLVTASGLEYGYELSGVLDGYALQDPGGRGVMYESHPYPWKDNWKESFVDVSEEHPIFIGEIGAPKERFDFIPPSAHEAPETFVPDALGLIQKHRLNWTGWSFHPAAAPVLLEKWDYEPTEYWGRPAKEALGGMRFNDDISEEEYR